MSPALAGVDHADLVPQGDGRQVTREGNFLGAGARAGMGIDEWLVDRILELSAIYCAGYAAAGEPGVREASGRDPKSFERWLEKNRSAFWASGLA